MASLRGHNIFYVDSADDDLAGSADDLAGSADDLAGSADDLAGGADDRPVVLVIHGFPTAGWDFHRVWPLLVPHMRLIIPDMLGFGFSAKPCPHRYGIFEQADLLEALMDRLDLSDVHLLAHDYGDTVAQELLARDQARTGHDRLFKSVCLLNGGLFPETHRARLIQKLLASPVGSLVNRLTTKSRFDKSFSAVFGPDSKPDARALDDFWGLITENDGRHVFTSLIGYMHERRINRERWVGALIHCPSPIQLINGSADPVSGAHMVARYRQLLGDRDEICALDGIGHYPQVEQPDQVAAAYLDFIDRHSAAFSSHPPQNRDRPS
jgi:pimeloyl-ACP methyl ester carboxylesterase